MSAWLLILDKAPGVCKLFRGNGRPAILHGRHGLHNFLHSAPVGQIKGLVGTDARGRRYAADIGISIVFRRGGPCGYDLAQCGQATLLLVGDQVFYHRPYTPHVGAELLKSAVRILAGRNFPLPGICADPDVARVVVAHPTRQSALAQVGEGGHGATTGTGSATSPTGENQQADNCPQADKPIFFRFFHTT